MIAIEWLTLITFCETESGKWNKVVLTSGIIINWVVLDAKQPMFTVRQVRAKIGGHRCIPEMRTTWLICYRHSHIYYTVCGVS